MPEPIHVVIHIEAGGLARITDPDCAPDVWRALRRAFPEVWAVTLMPTHVHLVVSVSPGAARRQMGACVSGMRRSHRPVARLRWGRCRIERVGREPRKLARHCRYVHLNAARAGIDRDPLRFSWSTHRDVIGAVDDPWLRPHTLAHALGRPVGGFVVWWHDYVCGDPSVEAAAARLPEPIPPSPLPRFGLVEIASAVAAATRGVVEAIRERGPARQLFLALARHAGWRDARLLADACATTPHAIRANRQPHAGLYAAALCLADPRLRRGHPP